MQPYWATHFMLPGQEHPHAKAISEALEHAREGVALLVGCEPFELVFTGSGTEANNLAILGTVAKNEPGHFLVSALEHGSVLRAAQSLAARCWEIEVVGCEENGVIDPLRFAARLRDIQRQCVTGVSIPLTSSQERNVFPCVPRNRARDCACSCAPRSWHASCFTSE